MGGTEREVVFRDEQTGVEVRCFTWENELHMEETRFEISRPPLPTNLPHDGCGNGMSLTGDQFRALAGWIHASPEHGAKCGYTVWPYTENNICILPVTHTGKHKDARGRWMKPGS